MVTAKVFRSRNTGVFMVVVEQDRCDSYVIECNTSEGAHQIARHINTFANVVRVLGEHEQEAGPRDYRD